MAELESQCLKADHPQFMSDPGLHEFITPHNSGFGARIKSRPEDFVVTEINSDGKVVVLDKYEAPPLPPPLPPSPPATSKATASRKWASTSSRPDPNHVPPLQELVSSDMFVAIEELSKQYKQSLTYDPNQHIDLGINTDKFARAELHFAVRIAFPVLESIGYKNKKGENGIMVAADPKYKRLLEALEPEEAEKVLLFVNTTTSPDSQLRLPPDPSKQHRTKVHQLMSELYGAFTFTKFEEPRTPPPSKVPKLEEGGCVPSTSAGNIKIRMKLGPKKRQGKTEDCNKFFTKFVLRKRNCETLAAILKLSHLLNCDPSQFQLSGTKDKIAVTTQEITAKGISAETLLDLRSQLNPEEIDIGNFEYVPEHLRMGGHVGNRFKILLREADCLEGAVTSSLEAVKRCGFINYYGLQRFSVQLTAPRIGLALLHNNVREAVNIALMESETIDPEGKEHIRQQRFDKALKYTRLHASRERLLLHKLNQYGSSDYAYSRALSSIPHTYRSLYHRSLSSLLWNHMASYRLREYGLTPVEGDLVMLRSTQDADKVCKVSERNWVHVLSSEDVASEAYKMEDVVLPVLGTSIIYPHNKVADKMKEMMAAIGITFASFRMRSLSWKNTAGAYRKLIVHPKNFTWRFTTPSAVPGGAGPLGKPSSPTTTFPLPDDSSPDGEHLELNFDLPSGAYATMLIREIAKRVL